MSRYDEMPTAELLAVPPGAACKDVDTLALWAAALRDRLAAYEPIVAAVRAIEHPRGWDGCGMCEELDYGVHAPDCPWWLAQQIGGGR